MFAIGGDAEQPNTGALKAQRFKPVVRFLGAEKLGAGKTNTHKIALPPYFGSVRVMVVASNGRAFGSAEKEAAVKKPLLVQATLPRVVSTDEEVELPVTVFALERGRQDRPESLRERIPSRPSDRSARRSPPVNEGEQVVTFRLKVKQGGRARAKGRVSATSSATACSRSSGRTRTQPLRNDSSEDYMLEPGENGRRRPR